MNKEQVKGRADVVKGKTKELAGKAVGNRRLVDEGVVDQVVGKTQAAVGDAKERLKDSLKRG